MFTGIYYQKVFHQLCWRRRLLKNFKTRSKIWHENEYFVQIARTLSAMGSVKLRFFLKFCSESWISYTEIQVYSFTLEVIIDYGSAFITYGKITETKSSPNESSFPAEVPQIKLIGAAN